MSKAELADAARAFLDGAMLLPNALSETEALALVESLVAAVDIAQLQRLAVAADKRAAKQARRGLHLLATRGHDVTTPIRTPSELPPGPYRR